MAKIEGKKTTITYEIITADKDIESLLNQVVSNTLEAIVNKNESKLKELLSDTSAAQTKAKERSSETKYTKENIEQPEIIPLGGKWAFSVAIVVDVSGEKVVRISKGQIRGGFYRDKGTNEMVLTPDDPMNPISLASKINIKTMEHWNKLQAPVISRLKALEEAPK